MMHLITGILKDMVYNNNTKVSNILTVLGTEAANLYITSQVEFTISLTESFRGVVVNTSMIINVFHSWKEYFTRNFLLCFNIFS